MKYVTYRTTGGMNTSEFATRLPDREATLLQNAEFREQRVWSMRKGYEAIGSTITGTPTVVEMVNFIKNDGTDYLCAFASDKLYSLTTHGGTFTDEGALAAAGTFDFDNFNNKLYIARQTSSLQSFDGTTVAAVGGSPPTSIRAVRNFRNHLFALANNSSRLYFSAIGNAESWTTGTDYIDVNKDDGDWGVGLGVLEDQLLIFKQYNIYALLGYNSATFEVISLLKGIGSVNHRTIQEAGKSIIWKAEKKILRLSNGGLDEISYPIKKTLMDMSQTFMGKSAYYPAANQYWLTIDENSDGSADAVLVFDLLEEKWTKYTGMAFSALCTTSISGADLPKKPVAGGYSNGVVYQLDYGTNDAGSDIAFEIDSEELDCHAPFMTKGFKDVWVWLAVDSMDTKPTLDYLIDGTAVKTAQTLTPKIADHMYPVHLDLVGDGRVIQLKIKHTGKTGGQLHVGGWTIGYEDEGAYH